VIELADIEDARVRLRGVIRPTPTVLNHTFSELVGEAVYLKPEHLQRTGSFKLRGAYNRISRIAEAQPSTHIVAASAGNHAQGVALASSLSGLRSTIFMPKNAALPKVAATRHYGAEVELGGEDVGECISRAARYAAERGAIYVPPFDDPQVAAGQGTVGLEILEECPPISTLIVPVGGGGLLAGIACAVRALAPMTRIIGVEASGAASMAAARMVGHPVELEQIETMADGIAIGKVSPFTLAQVERDVDDLVAVDDEAISRAVVLLLERAKWVVEPAGAIGLAALLDGAIDADGPVAIVLSGGNVDSLLLTRLIDHGLSAAGRYLLLRVVLDDRPGALAALSAAVAEMDLNVLGVDHHRSGTAVRVDEVEVLMTVETRDPEHRDEVVQRLRDRGFNASIRT
jgi:threonine dehydratase